MSMDRKQGAGVLRRMDWLMLVLVLSLHAIGLVVLQSMSVQLRDPGMFSKQLVATGIGFVLMMVIMFFDYKDFRYLGFIAYGITTVLLLLVMVIGFGYEEVGTSGWIFIGPYTFQPSELAKISMVLVAAYFLERLHEKPTWYHYLLFIILTALPVALILRQPDFGTAMVFVFAVLCMLFVFGFKYRYILISMGVAAATAIPFWVYVVPRIFDEYQILRILSFFNPSAYSKDAAYQVRMAIRAIGSGQANLDMARDYATLYVPASHTDMFFSVVGEKLGFYGASLTVILFALFLLRCIYVAMDAKDRFGSYVVIGLSGIFFAHFLENIGMNIGLLPVTGIPLPFMSLGGSSLIANDAAVGILLCISMRRRTRIPDGRMTS